MSKSTDFRHQRQQNKQKKEPPVQGVTPVTPEDVYNISSSSDSPSATPEPETYEPEEAEKEYVVKTTFYPTQDQLDKLDDLAAEYNKRYRRKRAKINRNDIVRFLIDECTIDSIDSISS
jgi:hypothetical protein